MEKSKRIGSVVITVKLDTRRQLKDGGYPVKIRTNFVKSQKYFDTGVSLTPTEWERIEASKSPKNRAKREIIETTFDKICKHVKKLTDADLFTDEKLSISLGKTTGSTINYLFTQKIEELNKDEKYSTSDWYRYALKALENYAGDNIQPQKVNEKFLKDYGDHLYEIGKSYTTISMYMRALQGIINIAISEGFFKQSNYPFGRGKYEIPQYEARKLALPIKAIGEIINYNCLSEKERFCRDLWVFSYLCNGANITDVCNLTYSNIIANGEDRSIQFFRQKTKAKSKIKKEIEAHLNERMQGIIDEWGNKDKDGFIFPILDTNDTELQKRYKIKAITRSINHYVNKIGKQFGIDGISTYTARHSYATVLKRSGVSIPFISESLGHSNIKVTEHYLDSFESDERKKNSDLLTNF